MGRWNCCGPAYAGKSYLALLTRLQALSKVGWPGLLILLAYGLAGWAGFEALETGRADLTNAGAHARA